MNAGKPSCDTAPKRGKTRPGNQAGKTPETARTSKAARPKTAPRASGAPAALAARAAGAKASGKKAAVSKTARPKPSSKAGGARPRSAARAKSPSVGKKGVAAKRASAKPASIHGRSSGGIAKRAVCAVARSYLARFAAVLVAVVAVVFIAVSAFSAQSSNHPTQRADGLPIYITDEMIDTARAMQHEYGHPAGCTIAQIVQESGQGDGLSELAERDNNLFGMKWSDSFAGKHGVVGPVEWKTGEEYDGQTVTVDASFIEFESQKACIEFRSSVFLQSSTYADNPTIRRAIETGNSALMAWGLQDAGWATDSAYAESLVSIMDRYDLYRFDS